MAPDRRARPFVFLDRDGTLVRDVGYPHRIEDYELLPGVVDALGDLRDAGFGLAIVTNQSGIGRGLFTRADYDRFHGCLLDDLAASGISIEATFMCPHAPDATCACRKPSAAPLLAARTRLAANLGASWVVGDHVNDLRLAANIGCRAVLVLTGHGVEERARIGDTPVDEVAPDLSAAVAYILARRDVAR